ncbi:protein FAM219A-like [Mercenaria mercenaria]|uniref:protein FAM219A-like n=1 Tax=Mercenaria mercenaria TaxID=6596 RepID=UPI001E1D3AE8|nr:protein FAM219A-like [Mercenaria mercenaria]
MDSKEDSGIDSDNKSVPNSSLMSQLEEEDKPVIETKTSTSSTAKNIRRTSELQKKIEKQREKTKRKEVIDEQPKRTFLIPRSRLNIPSKHGGTPVSQDELPLVAIVSDDSEEDEFAVPSLSKAAQREITEQLIKDGYNLDLDPDDEDLDLIPPRPFHERCGCCPSATWIPHRCAVQ